LDLSFRISRVCCGAVQTLALAHRNPKFRISIFCLVVSPVDFGQQTFEDLVVQGSFLGPAGHPEKS
jgi:hypothetical protein